MFWNNSRTFYNLSEALGSFGFLPLRGAGTGFVVVLPLPLIFDPPLYILHFTIYTTFHREATLKTALELLDYSVKIRSQVQTITRAILPRNQAPSVSNSQRERSCEQIFDISTTFLNPLVGTNSLYGKRTVSFFSLVGRVRLARFARGRLLRHALPISWLILRKKPTVLQSNLFPAHRCPSTIKFKIINTRMRECELIKRPFNF